MGSPSKTTDAGNYRDRFAVGNCLNIFSGNCVVSPPRKNKEKQCRITGQRVEVEGKARERGRGEPRKSRKRRRNGEEQRNDWGGGGGEWNGKRACKLSAILFRKGCFSSRCSVTQNKSALPLFCPPVHLRCRRDRSWKLWKPVFYLPLCPGSTMLNVVYFLWSLNNAANNWESQINVDWRREICSRAISWTYC